MKGLRGYWRLAVGAVVGLAFAPLIANSQTITAFVTDASQIVSGTLAVARGGTGVATSTGSGSVVLSTSPALTTPAVGVATGTSLALNGCTLGANAICATGAANFSGNMSSSGNVIGGSTGSYIFTSREKITSNADGSVVFTTNAGSQPTVSTLPSAATAGAGARSFVTDATACTFNAAPTGGGAVACPVFSTGAAWLEGG